MKVTGDLLTDEAYLVAVAQLIAPMAPSGFTGCITLETHWSAEGLAEVKVSVKKAHRPAVKVRAGKGR